MKKQAGNQQKHHDRNNITETAESIRRIVENNRDTSKPCAEDQREPNIQETHERADSNRIQQRPDERQPLDRVAEIKDSFAEKNDMLFSPKANDLKIAEKRMRVESYRGRGNLPHRAQKRVTCIGSYRYAQCLQRTVVYPSRYDILRALFGHTSSLETTVPFYTEDAAWAWKCRKGWAESKACRHYSLKSMIQG